MDGTSEESSTSHLTSGCSFVWTCDVLELDGVVAVVGSRVIYWRCRGSSPTFRSYSKVGDGRLVESTRVRAPRHVDARCGPVNARVMLR